MITRRVARVFGVDTGDVGDLRSVGGRVVLGNVAYDSEPADQCEQPEDAEHDERHPPVVVGDRHEQHPGDVAAQTIQTLRNVEAILAAGGASFADVLMLRVYLSTRDDFAAMNDAYGAFLAERVGPEEVLPCRTTVMVELPREEMLVEIDALAVLSSPSTMRADSAK